MTIRIPKQILTSIFDHAMEAFPNECCGFLFGKGDNSRQVTEWEATHNATEGDQRRRFRIDPIDYLQAERKAIMQNTTLVGIYHSHPLHPAIASEHDLLQAMPFFSYVIVSVDEDKIREVRSWRLADLQHQFLEETVRC